MSHGPDPENLTPGVIDGYALRAFKYGACGALALALHDGGCDRGVGEG